MSTIKWVTTLTMVAALGGVPRAWASNPEQSCQAGRAKATGRYVACIQAGVAKFYAIANATGDVFADYVTGLGRCVTRYDATYGRLQAKALASPGTETCDSARYVDNGDGTLTDNLTALQWEKKTDDASVHDKDNVYSWSTTGTAADGTAHTGFLATVNGVGFAGQYDWRLPTVAELLSITQPAYLKCTSAPCIAATFGPTVPDGYWSSTPYQANPDFAWGVHFGLGLPPAGTKPDFFYVRAVRGGF